MLMGQQTIGAQNLKPRRGLVTTVIPSANVVLWYPLQCNLLGVPGDWWSVVDNALQARTRRESDKLACVATDIINCLQPSAAGCCCLCYSASHQSVQLVCDLVLDRVSAEIQCTLLVSKCKQHLEMSSELLLLCRYFRCRDIRGQTSLIVQFRKPLKSTKSEVVTIIIEKIFA